jgi:hypothetical protein
MLLATLAALHGVELRLKPDKDPLPSAASFRRKLLLWWVHELSLRQREVQASYLPSVAETQAMLHFPE